MKFFTLIIFTGIYLFSGVSFANCGDGARQSKVYRAFVACQELRAAKLPTEINQLTQKITDNGFCGINGCDTNETLNKVCTDPAGYVCQQNQGRYLTTDCEIDLTKPEDVANTPDYVDAECRAQAQADLFFEAHKSECPSAWGPDICQKILKISHSAELDLLEKKAVYTAERQDKLTAVFQRIQKKYLSLIKTSTIIPENRKSMLIEKIRLTHLQVAPADDVPCMNTGAKGPETELFNQLSPDGKNLIVVCIGAMSLLDHLNEKELMMTIAHELSHSIDPCSIEVDYSLKDQGDPDLALKTFPKLLQCLRGGTGLRGCENGTLNCNSDQGITQFRHQYESAIKGSVLKKIGAWMHERQLVDDAPDCPMGKSDPRQDGDDGSDYRRDPQPVDQIQESFADFMGAEVVGHILQEDQQLKHLDQKSQLNALVATAASFDQLHGVCQKDNTHDEHPVGMIRMNRNIMSSKYFREALGCTNGPPHTKNAGVTCQGF